MTTTQTATFPLLARIIEGRREIVETLTASFGSRMAGPIWILTGPENGTTDSFAKVYRRLLMEAPPAGAGVDVTIHNLAVPADIAGVEALLSRVLQDSLGPLPTMIIYVGGQAVGDAAKLFCWRLRNLDRGPAPRNFPQSHFVFGGILTTLSNDGVFSDTASYAETMPRPVGAIHDLPQAHKSKKTVLPEFVLADRLTLMRQPPEMQISCIGDILSKMSSLYDYLYSCKTLRVPSSDSAADLTRSAYQAVLGFAETTHLTQAYLRTPQALDDLFRAAQLCGLAMQLSQNSAPCSGSEHCGFKWLDEFLTRSRVSPYYNKPLDPLTHGLGVLLMTRITLFLQGQTDKADRVADVVERLKLGCSADSLNIPARVIQICLALGLGFRCHKYLAYLLDPAAPVPYGDNLERITILEQCERGLLVPTIGRAMIGCGVAAQSDFFPVSDLQAPLLSLVDSAKSQLIDPAVGLTESLVEEHFAAPVRAVIRSKTTGLVL